MRVAPSGLCSNVPTGFAGASGSAGFDSAATAPAAGGFEPGVDEPPAVVAPAVVAPAPGVVVVELAGGGGSRRQPATVNTIKSARVVLTWDRPSARARRGPRRRSSAP